MPTPAQILDISAAALNDTAKGIFTYVAQLPYFNMAVRELQEIYELNDIAATYETSAAINCPAGSNRISYTGTVPQLPAGLIEVKQLWESQEGQENWTPMGRRDFLPHYLQGNTQQIPQFLIWAWVGNEIHLIPANQDNDIKIDFVKSLFSLPLVEAQLDAEIGFKYKNIDSFLGFKTAALCAMFIGENETRALALNSLAEQAMERNLGINVKGTQAIAVRRRPFRSGYKARGRIF